MWWEKIAHNRGGGIRGLIRSRKGKVARGRKKGWTNCAKPDSRCGEETLGEGIEGKQGGKGLLTDENGL